MRVAVKKYSQPTNETNHIEEKTVEKTNKRLAVGKKSIVNLAVFLTIKNTDNKLKTIETYSIRSGIVSFI